MCIGLQGNCYYRRAKASVTMRAQISWTVTTNWFCCAKAGCSTAQPGLCVWLEAAETFTVPVWTAAQVNRYLGDHYRSLERLLYLGPFQHLLPTALRRHAVIEQFDVPRFLEAVAALHSVRATIDLTVSLSNLLV
jgi:hypothetical protein